MSPGRTGVGEQKEAGSQELIYDDDDDAAVALPNGDEVVNLEDHADALGGEVKRGGVDQ